MFSHFFSNLTNIDYSLSILLLCNLKKILTVLYSSTCTTELLCWVKDMLKIGSIFQAPYCRRKELTTVSCPLTSKCPLPHTQACIQCAQVCAHLCTKVSKCKILNAKILETVFLMKTEKHKIPTFQKDCVLSHIHIIVLPFSSE